MGKQRNRNRTIIVAILILLIVSISIGYARISSTLQINGTAGISKNEWNVHFQNLIVTKGAQQFARTTGEGDSLVYSGEAHILSSDDKKIEYDVVLPIPGDTYEFEVDIVNDGSIPAELVDIRYTLNDKVLNDLVFVDGQASAMPAAEGKTDLFIFGMTYVDGSYLNMRKTTADDVVSGDVLAAKNDTDSDTKRIKVWVKYNDDIMPEDLNKEPLNAHLVIELLYAQQGK